MPAKELDSRENYQNQAALGLILTEVVQEKNICGPVVFIFLVSHLPGRNGDVL